MKALQIKPDGEAARARLATPSAAQLSERDFCRRVLTGIRVVEQCAVQFPRRTLP